MRNAAACCNVGGLTSLLPITQIDEVQCSDGTVQYTFVDISVHNLTPWDKSLVHNRELLKQVAVQVRTCRDMCSGWGVGGIILLTTAEKELV
jgi:hypothetical protein